MSWSGNKKKVRPKRLSRKKKMFCNFKDFIFWMKVKFNFFYWEIIALVAFKVAMASNISATKYGCDLVIFFHPMVFVI